MIDLDATTEPIERHLRESLRDFTSKNGAARVLFYHTHPGYGQFHLYLSTNESAEPYDDLVGTTIDYIIDFDDWEEQFRQLDAEESRLEIRKVGGETLSPKDSEEFNTVIAEHVAAVTENFVARDEDCFGLKKIFIQSEWGEFCADWKPTKCG